MTTKFVNSGAAGANNGTSWTDAWVALGSATGAAAGDIVKVHKSHSQTGVTANILFGGTKTNPVYVICVDKDNSDALATGASIRFLTSSGVGIGGNIRCYGITVSNITANTMTPVLYAPSDGHAEFEQCTMTSVSTGVGFLWPGNNTGRCLVRFINCTFDMSGAAGQIATILDLASTKRLEFIGCTFTAKSGQTNMFRLDSTIGGAAVFRGCVFNGTVTNIIDFGATRIYSEISFDYCTMPTYTNVFDSALDTFCSRLEVRNSVGGTISAPVIGPSIISDYAGTITTDLTRYRTGGANDGTSPYSFAMATNTLALETHGFLFSPPILRRVASGAQTITIYIASGTTYQNDEVWVELLSPSEAGSATAQARFQSSQMAVLGTAGNLTTDGGSTWTGSGVGTLQKVSFSIAPTVAGIVVARVFLARASQTIYVDPFIGVS